MLQDFPLWIGAKWNLPGEAKSTITRDNVLAAMAKRTGNLFTVWSHVRCRHARWGAIAYVPSELALGAKK